MTFTIYLVAIYLGIDITNVILDAKKWAKMKTVVLEALIKRST